MIQTRHVRRAHSQSQLSARDPFAESYRDGTRSQAHARQSVGLAGRRSRRCAACCAATPCPVGREALSMQRSCPWHVAAALGPCASSARSAVVAGWPQPSRKWRCGRHDRCAPDRAGLEAGHSAAARRETATCSLGQVLGLGASMSSSFTALSTGWSNNRADREGWPAPLKNGTLVLYESVRPISRPHLRAGPVRAQS